MLGDVSDFVYRIRSVLPKRWFPDQTPILDELLTCFASPFAWCYSIIQYVKLQTRIGSATDGWLDLVALDFLGRACSRKPNEADTAFRGRIQSAIVSGAATRSAVITAIGNLTGANPTVFEPARCDDTGAYGAWAGGRPLAYKFAYGAAGRYGSLNLPYQFFLDVKRPATSFGGGFSGYGCAQSGYGVGDAAYVQLSELSGLVTDTEIQAAVCRLLPITAVAWLRIN